MNPSEPPAVVLAGVGKSYGERRIIDQLSLRIAAGERVALLGESGSGKSTLLNLIAGLEPADAGRIEVAGVDVSRLDADGAARLRRHTIGFVFQAFHLLPHLNAVQNVAVPLLLAGLRADAAQARSGALLARVGLGGRLTAMPRELSGGEQQRVALARALVNEPRLILADEPTGNLDAGSAAQALRLIAELTASGGAALLLVTHSAQAAAIAERQLRLGPDGLTELHAGRPPA
ncbi:MAG: ABC transporter ATP-binding protein [Burkholderiaceae bacterium]